jgi:hypothetical protein
MGIAKRGYVYERWLYLGVLTGKRGASFPPLILVDFELEFECSIQVPSSKIGLDDPSLRKILAGFLLELVENLSFQQNFDDLFLED